ncbi:MULTISPECIES: prepilin-type N-terminal cleavage/methylation domain-containing protein [unclassified Leptolyngbya]|uniref:prepilin-type N-terminal cleavage/methylation domain-containing protein n=1 Tax=unclassified Leptolyngbya TaxID=2650499 RepID=UPI0016892591|nr:MULTISPECIES: prepilin-type N-terminal cleavage/methylation domain-containing protein [unclassified Leptolyngbya]MBD1913662.1 prepilin-type N-terminal cleavage/methylation domain-containing protein [Leptolyngbya sp. FACHB-8]MBD2157042.1 prepilin-type N-terminal cleavage/methylation domain-containing protein [Leptolyngbya sp. FACHB-16]
MKRLLRFLHYSPTTAGFTIVELIIAMVVTSIMITLAGYGLTTMLRANQQSGSEISRRANLNRALDFMADEVRMARTITVPTSTDVPSQSCGPTTGVMTLVMPDSSRIVYYVHEINGCSGNLWTATTIRRRVVGGADTLLVDALTAPSAMPSGCTATTQTLRGTNGFYACLDSANTQLVTLFLYGRLTDARGNTTGTYPVSGQASARSF